jgi:hypothetical protein
VRLRLLSPGLGVGLIAAAIGGMVTLPSHADGETPVKLYFHTTSSYTTDVQNDPQAAKDGRAPATSVLNTTAPPANDITSAQVRYLPAPSAMPGSPGQPSFVLPGLVEPVTKMCIDVWLSNSTGNSPAAELNAIVTLDDIGSDAQVVAPPLKVTPYKGSTVRVTGLVTIPSTKYAAGSTLMINGDPALDLGWIMTYDSKDNPSSITMNPTSCGGPLPTGSPTSGSPTSTSPTGSPASTPPTGTPTPTATGSGSPTATPTPIPTYTGTAETAIEYTGATSGRYGDSAPVSAKVTTSDGRPIPVGTVEFSLGTQKVTAEVGTDGVARGSLPIRTNAGQQLLTAKYVTDNPVQDSAAQVPFEVTRMPVRCSVVRSTSSSTYTITGVFKDAYGRPLAAKPIVFSYNGRAFKTVTTGSTGKATATAPARRGTYTVTFKTTSQYSGCSAAFSI